MLTRYKSARCLSDHDRASVINPVHLKDRLRNIKTDRANLAHGRLPSMWFAFTQPPYGTLDASERAPSTASVADMCSAKSDVRFTPNSYRKRGISQRGLSALPQKAEAHRRSDNVGHLHYGDFDSDSEKIP